MAPRKRERQAPGRMYRHRGSRAGRRPQQTAAILASRQIICMSSAPTPSKTEDLVSEYSILQSHVKSNYELYMKLPCESKFPAGFKK